MGSCLSTPAPKPNAKRPIEPVCLSASDIAALPEERYPTRERGRLSWRTLISSPQTPTDTLTAGIASLPPKAEGHQPPSLGGNLALHRHVQPELYFVLEGEGIVNVDMVEYEVKKGSVVFIPGNAEHGVRNASTTEKFVWYFVFAAEGLENVRYRFKNEIGV